LGFKKPPCFKKQGCLVDVTERFVTVDEFSLGWNPVRRCAQNRKILRQREGHVVCGGGKGAAFGGSRRAPYKGTIMPGRRGNYARKKKAGRPTRNSIPINPKNHLYLFHKVFLMNIPSNYLK